MTIRSLELRNFKCFAHANVALGSLTMLTGFNAGGKSTTLQSLLLVAQWLRTSPQSKYVPLNGPLVRLGAAGDVVRQGGAREIEFLISDQSSCLGLRLSAVNRDELNAAGRKECLELVEPHSADSSNVSLRETIESVVFLGASRYSQQEVFPAPDDADPVNGDVGNEGQFAPWLYVKFADNEVDELRRSPNETAVTFRAQVDAWLGHLFPGGHANAEAISSTSFTRLEFRIGRGGRWSRPSNIGYGLSYAFPLVVALLAARKGQTVVIDSPEAHLHPRAQSRLGEMLGQISSAGVQILVETHSDHILSGVRLSVQRKVLKAEELNVHFFSGSVSESENGIVSPAIYSDGRLSDWPDGFFDQAENDLLELAKF